MRKLLIILLLTSCQTKEQKEGELAYDQFKKEQVIDSIFKAGYKQGLEAGNPKEVSTVTTQADLQKGTGLTGFVKDTDYIASIDTASVSVYSFDTASFKTLEWSPRKRQIIDSLEEKGIHGCEEIDISTYAYYHVRRGKKEIKYCFYGWEVDEVELLKYLAYNTYESIGITLLDQETIK